MGEDLLCKRDGCGHPLSVHQKRRAEQGGSIVADPMFATEGAYNPNSDKSDDACGKADCKCSAFISPRGVLDA